MARPTRPRSAFWFCFARSPAELAACQRLRFAGFREELGIPGAESALVPLDVSPFDALPTTHHVLVYAGERLAATARFALGDAGARRLGKPVGVELEGEFVVPAFADLPEKVAEIGRVCVLRRWHGTWAAVRLYEALVSRSHELGIRYWYGGVDLQTDDGRDAELQFRALEAQGLVSKTFEATALPQPKKRAPIRQRFYTDEERGEARRGELAGLRLAPAVREFVVSLGARALGRPALHPAYPRWVVPMVVDVEALPERTLALLDRSLVAPRPRSREPDTRNSSLDDSQRLAS